MKLLKTLAVAASLYAPLSFATVFEFTTGPGQFGPASHNATYDSIFTSYDDSSNILTWEVDNAVKNGVQSDGFWVVLNDGPDNPKGADGLAMFYADFNADTVWAYQYTGANNAGSYLAGPLLESFTGLTNNGTTRGFTINVESVFNQLSSEQPFSEEVGIWYHPTFGTSTSVDRNGALESWGYNSQSWYDRAGQDTTVVSVSEPAPMYLLSLGLFALFLRKKAA